ncbi:MAG: sorbosone dehydrogenase family protein [Armatimonadetes bacterium]|nr:sorbosone dehydrogenase family protein [Armatimonadota bacterium]
MDRRFVFGLIAASATTVAVVGTTTACAIPGHASAGQTQGVRTGQAALDDWTGDAPGVRRKITVADLPEPYSTRSVDNGPHMVRRPEGAWPKVPEGFKVTEYMTGLNNPREIVTAPNGDLFIAESGPGRIRILRGRGTDGRPTTNEVFASGLHQPFGIAFYPPGPNPQYVYIGDTDAVVRYAYHNGDLHATGEMEHIADLPGGGRLRGGGHWSRDVRFRADGKKMYVSVGSLTNDHEGGRGEETHRADILEFDPDGKNERIYAYGIRNAVGLGIHPKTHELWCSINERDGLGDDLPPDYITRVKEGGFYGWPWFYIGNHQDPRHPGEHPELKDKVLVPEVLVGSHQASLCMTFYTGSSFPKEYDLEPFAAEHGSWNRAKRVGYKVIRVVTKDGAPTGVFEDFMTGFVTEDGNVWGRPVGVAVAPDGAMMVSDDGSGTIWRIQHEK